MSKSASDLQWKVEANRSRIPLIKECATITREGAEGREPERMRPERVKQAKHSQHLMQLAIQSAESRKDGQDEENRIPPL